MRNILLRLHYLICLSVLLGLLGPLQSFAAERPKIRLACLSSPDMPDYQYVFKIQKKAFANLGYDLELITLSSEEARYQLQQGAVDGDCARSANYDQLPGLPKLIRTSSAIRQAYIAAWSLNGVEEPDVLRIDNRDTLRFGFLSGSVFLEELSHEMGFKQVVLVDSTEQGLELLRKGAIDIWLDYEAKFGGSKRALLGSDVTMVGAVASLPVYPFLLQKHADLIEPLSVEISRMTKYRPYLHDVDLTESVNANKDYDILFSCVLSPKVPSFAILNRLYRQAFENLGYRFKMITLPLLRAEAEILSGRIDGSCARAGDFFKVRPNLVRVPEKIIATSFQAWSHSPKLRIKNPDALKDKGYSVGSVRGSYAQTAILNDLDIRNTVVVTSPTIGMKMLAAGRLDVFVENAQTIQSIIQRLNIDKPLYMVGDIRRDDVYPALRPGLEALAEPLAKELQALRNQ